MVQPIILDRLRQDWYGPTWVLDSSTGIWTNTPTLVGGELALNTDVELFDAGGLANNFFSSTGSLTTIETIQENTIKRGGSYSQGLRRASGTSWIFVGQIINQTLGSWYVFSPWLYGNGSNIITKVQEWGGAYTLYTQELSSAVSAAWTQRSMTYRRSGAVAPAAHIIETFLNSFVYFDDFSVKQILFPTLFKTRLFPSALGTVAAKLVNSPAGTQSGVCMGLNSQIAPTYGVIGYHNGTNAKLEYFLNGEYTTSINTAIAFVANALIEIRHTDVTTYQLWYNGSQVLGDITINDATLNNSRRHGMFSTYVGNQIKDFSFVPA